jgi:hypothetical protein
MKNKIKSLIICVFLIASFNVIAGNINDPEITDTLGDAFGYLDIDSVWFYEDEDKPELLFVAMKINEPSLKKFQQTFAVFWKYNEEEYACSLHLGFDIKEDWEQYNTGESSRKAPGGFKQYRINGTYSTNDGIILWEIPKEYIGNPQKDDILTNTWSNAFRRLGFLGRIGFSRPVIDNLIYRYFENSLWDYAPDNIEEYGRDYMIKY